MDHMADRCTRLRGYAQDEVEKDLLWMRERKADLHLKMMKSACLQNNFGVASKIVGRLDAEYVNVTDTNEKLSQKMCAYTTR